MYEIDIYCQHGEAVEELAEARDAVTGHDIHIEEPGTWGWLATLPEDLVAALKRDGEISFWTQDKAGTKMYHVHAAWPE